MRPPIPLQEQIPYEISPEPMEGTVTRHGSMSTLSHIFRGMKLPGVCEANLGFLRKIDLGFTVGEMVESLVCGILSGAECLEDLGKYNEDAVVARILGYRSPSTRSLRDWLEKFHDPELIAAASRRAEELELLSFVPEPSPGLRALQVVLGASACNVARRLPSLPKSATVDLDGTIIECDKHVAQYTYKGTKGYQPLTAVWAEADTILATEFRDGNVPGIKDPLSCTKMAFAALPKGIETYAFRGDSANDNQGLLDWLDAPERADGPKEVKIEYAISARMNSELLAAVKRVEEDGWTTFEKQDNGVVGQWAELDYVPGLKVERKDAKPRRYVGLRFLKNQGELFEDGNEKKHFAIVTNSTKDAPELINWHRKKAGTIEHVNDEMKNALAADRLPSKYFGANAAWFAINAIAYNVASAIRASSTEIEIKTARIKRLRLDYLRVTVRLTRFSRKITMRYAATKEWIAKIRNLLAAFPCRYRPTG